jgi:VWFA-related protein
VALCVAGSPIAMRADERVQGRTFRARSSVVTVDVSVQRGNQPVTGLAAQDFELRDNGVVQQIDAVSVEAVPVDVSLVVDVSGSTAGSLERFQRDVLDIGSLLRPIDRLRLIAFGTEVRQVFPFRPASSRPSVEQLATSGLTSVNDAVVMALISRPVLGRRHLVVVFTDGQDNLSTVPAETVRDVAVRSEALLHVVWAGVRGGSLASSGLRPIYGGPENSREMLEAAAEVTGGRAQGTGLFSRSLVGPFERIFAELRTSYVLSYAPEGVEPEGWHSISVRVNRPERLRLRARQGYWGG